MRERIRRISGWIAVFLVMVSILMSVTGCGSRQGAGDIPVRTEEAHTLSSGESRTSAQEAGTTGYPGKDTLLSGESQTPVQEADTAESQARDTSAASGSEESEAPGSEAWATPRSEESEASGMEAWEASGTEKSTDTGLTVLEGGSYTSKEEVALYLHLFGELPSNFITKKEAEALGWKKEPGAAGELQNVAPGKSIGGDRFGNYEKLLPEKEGRKYFECDINYVKGSRGAERIIYSNDGLIFYTGDHYKTFEKLYP